jgi:antibiotic biosynthesis monooxygenase (ABM) superfamily enzyme
MTTTSRPDRRTPTVVVARRVLPGHEREFQRWVRRLLDAAADAPGYVGSELQPPDDLHPDEWIVLYQFQDADTLSAWLDSATRTELIARGAHLIDGDAREQVVALVPERDPVTAVSSVRVRPGQLDAYRALHDELVERLRTFDGFLRCELFEPVDGVQADTVVVFSFDDRRHLDAWLGSDDRREILERMAPIVEGDRTVNVVGGFAGWFTPVGVPGVRPWKQATAVLLALFPVSLATTVVRQAVAPDLPTVPAVLVANVVGVAALTWLIMPRLTRRLDGWLRR